MDNGYKHSASCGQEKKGPGKTQLALTQAQVDFTATLEADTNQTDAPIASLQRSLIFGSYFSQHGDCQDGTMEVLALQKDLQWSTCILWRLWTTMAEMLRPQFCSSKTRPQSKKGSMELQSGSVGRVRTARLNPMGPTTTSQKVAKTEIQKGTDKIDTSKRQRERQAIRRCSSFWAASIACYFQYGTTMDDAQYCVSAIASCSRVCQWGQQHGQGEGQAFAYISCSLEEAQRGLARGRPTADERDECPVGAGGNETPTFSSISAWSRKEGSASCASCTFPDAYFLAQLFVPISHNNGRPMQRSSWEQEKLLTERLQTAKENLSTAKENLGNCKVAAGLEEKEDTTMHSDSEELACKDSQTTAGKRIAESFTNLSTSLQALHSQAEQAVQQEEEDQIRKRQRTGPRAEEEALDSNLMKPSFGGAE